MKPRNPVAGNSWKYNQPSRIAPKKGKGAVYKRSNNISPEDQGSGASHTGI